MSFLTLLWPFPQSFFFFLLPEKQAHAVFDPSGREAPLKERWRGSIWGQKTTKRPLLLWFWCYVTTPSLLFWSCFRSHNLPFFTLDIASANPIPPWLSSILHLSLPPSLFLSPSLSFHSKAGGAFISWLPAHFYDGSLSLSEVHPLLFQLQLWQTGISALVCCCCLNPLSFQHKHCWCAHH